MSNWVIRVEGRGIVLNEMTGEPRLFPTEAAANEYGRLSSFRGYRVQRQQK